MYIPVIVHVVMRAIVIPMISAVVPVISVTRLSNRGQCGSRTKHQGYDGLFHGGVISSFGGA